LRAPSSIQIAGKLSFLLKGARVIDYWRLTRDFKPGDTVQRVLPGQGVSPYVGRVLAVLPAIGFLDIQWPCGYERVSPEEVILLRPGFEQFLPPQLTFGYYPGLEVKNAGMSRWRTTEVPPGFHKELARVFHRQASEIQAYDELWHRFASFADDEAIRDEVAKFYRFASNTFDLLVQQMGRTAAYWAGRDRNYRATQDEIGQGRPNCPRCGGQMRKTTYKMSEGQRAKLFACPSCLYLIKQDNVLGPGGEPIGW
jgi:hypothetical protein